MHRQTERENGDLWCLIAKSYFDSLSKGQLNNKGMPVSESRSLLILTPHCSEKKV